jgi:hypothetical protein
MLLALTLFASCECESGSARSLAFSVTERQEQMTDSFSAIELEGHFEVYLFNGDQHKVILEGDEEILEWVVLNVDDGVLKVAYLKDKVIKKNQSVILEITVKDLKELSAVSTLKLITPNVFTFDTLHFDLAGAVSLELNVEGQELEVYGAGATSIKARGEVESVNFEMPGAGKLEGFDLKAEKVVLNLAGAGKAEVFASEELKVDIAGACSVVYKGDPEKVYSNVSGIGRVKQAD